MRILALLFAATVLLAGGGASAAQQPNILFILIDDLGWKDLACQDNPHLSTPRIDALAAQGMRFTDAYAAAPVCSPTRAGLMTGRYPIRFGSMRAVYPPWRKGGLDPAEKTIADGLAAAGYSTGAMSL